MDTIKNYLDTMFSKLPITDEVIRAKEELFSMMEDKYYELKEEGKTENEAIGTVISEFGNLSELEEGLGVSKEIKIEEKKQEEKELRAVSMDMTKTYIDLSTRFAKKIALGVFLCICSPVLLIVLAGFAEENYMNENITTMFGLVSLFLFIAVAVVLFICSSMKLEKYEYLKKETFLIDQETEKYVIEQKEAYYNTHTICIAVGTTLCILSIIPTLVVATLFKENEFLAILSVGVLLLLVACGVAIFIITGMRMESYKVILQEEEFAKSKKDNKLVGTVASIYWSIVVCIYLVWSFITSNWHMTWIIWPLAGVLFGVVAVICNVIDENLKRMKQ